MQILSGKAPDEAFLQLTAFTRRLSVHGLPPEKLEPLMKGRPSGRAAWQQGLEIFARLVDEADDPNGEPQQFDYEDGRALLSSGAGGTVQIQPHHRLGDVLQPISLNLLLAQQWARAGLMMVHGAAFEIDGTGILAMGEREAGKSVLTAAVLAAGGRIASDDWVMVGKTDDGTFRAERLRDFLMFRKSRATETLLERLPDLAWRARREDAKQVIEIEKQAPEKFPGSIRIDRIWLLEPSDSVRPPQTGFATGSPVDTMKALMRATTPMLLSSRLPRERRALMDLTRSLTNALPADRVRTGLDIVKRPENALRKSGPLKSAAS